MLCDTGFAAL